MPATAVSGYAMAGAGTWSIHRDAAWLLLLCTGLALLSAGVVRRMIALAVMDVPGGRSAHDRPTPKGGGVGMLAAILIGLPLTLALLPAGPRTVPAACLMMLAVLLLGGISWLDDVRQFGFQAKLGAQVAAAILTIAAVLSTMPVLPPAWILVLALPASLCWLLLVTNAMNFIDGINGLAAGCTALAGLFVALLGWMRGDALLVALSLPASAGLLGFLPFNYPRARIFLGDVGSQVCGLLAGSEALFLLNRDASDRLDLALPVILAAVLWDVLFTLARRLHGGERLTQAHRSHLYQVASRVMMPASSVTALHWVFVIWGGLLALAVLPTHPLSGLALALCPQLCWTVLVRHRARRAGPAS